MATPNIKNIVTLKKVGSPVDVIKTFIFGLFHQIRGTIFLFLKFGDLF